jgi:RNA ligase
MFDRERLDAMVGEGWLRSQRHPDADLWIYNYTEKAQFENHWTPETLACRGLILDALGTVRARPFPKFFNYGSPQIGQLPNEPFIVTEKIDGSLGILYWLEGTRMLREQTIAVEFNTTALFEIVYPENRIVVDYGDRRELVLLGAIDNKTGFDVEVHEWSGAVAPRHGSDASLADLEASDRPNCEGYVVAFESGLRVKIKHAEYVRLHKLITGVNARHIWEILGAEGELEPMLDGIPDELHQWIQKVQLDLFDAYMEIECAAADVFAERPETGNRKTLAQYFQASGANTAVLFRMLDGKPYRDLIWKAIKPEPTTPDTIWTRDLEALAA